MTKYKNLAELVGKENILEKKDLLKLKGSKLYLLSEDYPLREAILYTENDFDFGLVFKSIDDSFAYILLTPEIMGKDTSKDNSFYLARPPGYAFIHKGNFPMFSNSYISVKNAFDKIHGNALPKVDVKKMSLGDKKYDSSAFSSEFYIYKTDVPYSNPEFVELIQKKKSSLEEVEKSLFKTGF